MKEEIKWQDGTLVQFCRYSSYTDEGGDDIFSNEPDDCDVGIILGDEVLGRNQSMVNDYELSKEDFVNGVYETGVSEEGGHDVYEYLRAELLPNPLPKLTSETI